jgi:hypothetical protein
MRVQDGRRQQSDVQQGWKLLCPVIDSDRCASSWHTLVSIFLSRFLKSLLSASSFTSAKDVRASHCSWQRDSSCSHSAHLV